MSSMCWYGGSPPHPIACRCSGVGLLHLDHNIQGLCSQTHRKSSPTKVEDDNIFRPLGRRDRVYLNRGWSHSLEFRLQRSICAGEVSGRATQLHHQSMDHQVHRYCRTM